MSKIHPHFQFSLRPNIQNQAFKCFTHINTISVSHKFLHTDFLFEKTEDVKAPMYQIYINTRITHK